MAVGKVGQPSRSYLGHIVVSCHYMSCAVDAVIR